MKRLLSIALIAITAFAVHADDISFRATAPQQVVAGKPFQLTYTINQQGKDLRAPDFSGFDVLAGPYTSTSSQTSFVNGKISNTYTQTYTYTLIAQKEGTYALQPATITISRQQYTSNGLKIKVLPPDEDEVVESRKSKVEGSTTQQENNTTKENIFVRTIVSKTKLYEQECLLLQYKLYFADVDVTQLTNNTKLPEFKGFLKQEIEQGEVQTQLEHYNGRNYYTAILYQTLLYPQHSGELQIEPAQFEAVLRVQTRSQVRSIFDDFFGSYTNVTRSITAPAVKITAQALPKGKPQNFSAAVGRFNLKSQISAEEVMQNDAVTLKIDISGTGNLKLIKTPSVDFPEGFEEYDPKVSNNFKTTTNGITGTKSIEYLFIPRAAGVYEIPSVSFSYFDTQENAYKTLSTPEYTLNVIRAATGEQTSVAQTFANKEDIKQLQTDIRYINTDSGKWRVESEKPLIEFGSIVFWLCYLIPLLVAITLFIIFRKQIKENADIRRVRYKKANKVAQKRLRQAKKYLAENNDKLFYEEIERAALLYLSDRLSIPTAELNKENISSVLSQKNVQEDIIKEVIDLLSTAEFARYAPVRQDTMESLYERTTNLIDKLENQKL